MISDQTDHIPCRLKGGRLAAVNDAFLHFENETHFSVFEYKSILSRCSLLEGSLIYNWISVINIDENTGVFSSVIYSKRFEAVKV